MTATIILFPKSKPEPLHLAGGPLYPCGAADCSVCGEEHVHDFVTDAMDWALSSRPCKEIVIIGGAK